MEVRNNKFTQKYTKVYCEDDWKFGAPHHFNIETASDNQLICHIDFQEGPIKENGINGIANEDALLMVLTRLEGFQTTEYRCAENQEAIVAINEAIDALRRRTNKRESKGIEGTSEI